MDDVGLANYMAGAHFGPVEAGRTDHLCAKLLGVKIGTAIWFSDYTFQKMLQKHGYINFSHYRHMPSILLHGFVANGRKPGVIELWWVERNNPEAKAYLVVLKATKKGEVFVETFHRINLKEARRLLNQSTKQGRCVREQLGIERELALGTDHLKSKKRKEVA